MLRRWSACVVLRDPPGKEQPLFRQREVEERLRALLGEIYHDEILQSAYLRPAVSMGDSRRPWIAPAVAAGVMREVPQFYTLGCSQRECVLRLRRGLEIPPARLARSAPAVRLSGKRLRLPFSLCAAISKKGAMGSNGGRCFTHG